MDWQDLQAPVSLVYGREKFNVCIQSNNNWLEERGRK